MTNEPSTNEPWIERHITYVRTNEVKLVWRGAEPSFIQQHKLELLGAAFVLILILAYIGKSFPRK